MKGTESFERKRKREQIIYIKKSENKKNVKKKCL